MGNIFIPPLLSGSCLLASLWKSIPSGRGLQCIILAALCVFTYAPNAVAQNSKSRVSNSVNGRLKVWIPSGLIGDDFWIYVDGRLKSAPPHGNQKSELWVKFSSLGGWEAWDGNSRRVLTSIEYNSDPDKFVLRSKAYGIFQEFEYDFPPGSLEVDFLAVDNSGPTRMSPLPFAGSKKQQVLVRAGKTTNVYLDIPDDFGRGVWSAPYAETRSLCSESTINLKQAGSDFLAWANSYKNNKLVKHLRAAIGVYSPESNVVSLVLSDGTREFDGAQIELMANLLSRWVSDNSSWLSHSQIAACKSRFPQYSQALTEFDKTLTLIEEDIKSFQKLATNLKQNQ